MRTLILITIACATILSGSLCATTITSTFDANLDGWVSNVQGTIAFVATGGNLDGYLEETDASSTGNMHVAAPGKFLGDISFADTLTVDVRTFATPGSIPAAFGTVTFLNSTAALSMALDLGNPAIAWTTYTAGLNAAAFGVSSATFSSIMSNVTSITLVLEADRNSNTEKVGMDNFSLSGAGVVAAASEVPEPATWGLSALTLALCGLYRNRIAGRA